MMSEAENIRRAMLEDSAQPLTSIKPQRRNANRHTPRGMGALEGSIQRDGWIGAITVAADGETFDGSARLEVGTTAGFEDAIIVESDGSRPIVVKRTDIPSADDARAVRLGLAANRVASLNLEWEPDVLAELAAEMDLSALFSKDELAELAQPALPMAGAGGDEFDATPEDGPTRAQLGDLWVIGGKHRLLVGDCTDAANVAQLMGGERAALGFADPPYGAKVDEWDKEFVWDNDYLADMCDVVVVTPGISSIQEFMSITKMPYQWSISAWISNGFARGAIGFGNWMYGAVFSHGSIYRQAQDFLKIDLVVGQADGEYHRGQKPPKFMQWVIELFTKSGEIMLDTFGGSGTSWIAAHRTGRRCYGMEISPRYADVILRRAEAEGLTVEREP